MLLKMPSNDSLDQIELIFEEEDILSEIDEEPDFAEYMWMENEEEFDKTEMQRLEEEDIMNECYEAMLEDELEEQLAELEQTKKEEFNKALSSIVVRDCNVENSLLNPLADEFIPNIVECEMA